MRNREGIISRRRRNSGEKRISSNSFQKDRDDLVRIHRLDITLKIQEKSVAQRPSGLRTNILFRHIVSGRVRAKFGQQKGPSPRWAAPSASARVTSGCRARRAKWPKSTRRSAQSSKKTGTSVRTAPFRETVCGKNGRDFWQVPSRSLDDLYQFRTEGSGPLIPRRIGQA